MRRIHDYAIAALICAGAVVASATRANQSNPSPQVTLEHQFDAAIDVGEMLYWLKRMSSEPCRLAAR